MYNMVFSKGFVTSLYNVLSTKTKNGQSVTRQQLCEIMDIDSDLEGIFKVLLRLPKFQRYEMVPHVGIRVRKPRKAKRAFRANGKFNGGFDLTNAIRAAFLQNVASHLFSR